MQKLIAAALFAVALTGCGAPQTTISAPVAASALEAQAAGKTAIKKAATEAVTAEVKEKDINVTEIKVKTVKLEDTVLGYAQKFIATVETTGRNPFGVEERTYEVTGIYNPTNKKAPATVSEVKLTRQSR
jgi:hypothetical protein